MMDLQETRRITEERLAEWRLDLLHRPAIPIALIALADSRILVHRPDHISDEHLVGIINWALEEIQKGRPPHARLSSRPRPHDPGPGPPR